MRRWGERSARCAHRHRPAASSAVERFLRVPSVPVAVRILKEETDADRAWVVFRRVIDTTLFADARLFQVMMSLCRRACPGKAPDVMQAAVSAGMTSYDDTLFCTFLGACQVATPPLVRPALHLYRQCGPRSHNVIFGVANLCRVARQPDAALFLVDDAIKHRVLSEQMLSLLAAVCAESSSSASDVADRLLDVVIVRRDNAVDVPPPGHAVFANLFKALLAGGRLDRVSETVRVMDDAGLAPSLPIYTMVLSALARARRTRQAMAVFETMVQRDVPVDSPVLSLLVSCCTTDDAAVVQTLYDYATGRHRRPDLLRVPIVVAAFARAFGRWRKLSAVEDLECHARRAGLFDEPPVFSAFVAAYGSCLLPQVVQALEQYASGDGSSLIGDVAVVAAFVSAYGRCGNVPAAERVFASLQCSSHSGLTAACKAMIATYTRQGVYSSAVDTFSDRVSASAGRGCDDDDDGAVVSDVLVSYSKLDRVREAMCLFRKHPFRATPAAFASLVAACGRCSDLCALNELKRCAGDSRHLRDDVVVGNAFVSAYAACGMMDDVGQVAFRSGFRPDVVTWTLAIDAFARAGQGPTALALFGRMKQAGARPDHVTLTAVLRACRDLGRANALLGEFAQVWQVPINAAHELCLLDLHGRAGRLDVAERLARNRPSSVRLWVALLRACSHHNDAVRGERAYERIRALHSEGAAGSDDGQLLEACHLILDLYARTRRFADATRVRSDMQAMGIAFPADETTLMLPDQAVMRFGADDARLREDGLSEAYMRLMVDLVRLGYDPDTGERPRRRVHSAMIAVVYALQQSHLDIRASSTCRICTDCHKAIKIVTSVTGCAVFIREPGRHHYFRNGACSCGDYR
ncbi:DYW domain-containing protein [Plasmodiophora brassicae]